MKILVPTEITFENVAERLKNSHSQNFTKKFIAKCCDFLVFLYTHQLFHTQDLSNNFVPLMASIIGNQLGKNPQRSPIYYVDILLALEKSKLIIINHSYSKQTLYKKGEAKGYKLNLSSSSQKCMIQLNKHTSSLFKVDDEQYLSNLRKISIDVDKFVLLANTLTLSKKNRAMSVFDLWENDNHRVKTDVNGRIHSLISSLPKETRLALNVNGEPLYEVDIHACQPFLLLFLLKKQNKKFSVNLERKIVDELDNLEVKKYLKTIQEGKFYEDIYRSLKRIPNKPIDKDDLNKFKKKLLAIVFFSDIRSNVRGVVSHFEKMYPSIYKIITAIKQELGYKFLSNELQKIESKVMNETLEILQDNTCEWHLRFHDAILCTQMNVDLVSDALKYVLKENIDFEPFVKNGLWSSQNFEDLINLQSIRYFKTMRRVYFNDERLNTIKLNVTRVFSSNLSSEEKKQKCSTYKCRLREMDPQEVFDAEENYVNAKFNFPSTWNSENISLFKLRSFNLIKNNNSDIAGSDLSTDDENSIKNFLEIA